MLGTVYCVALLIVAVICAGAVLYHRYDDNLLQRIGMAVICLGAIGEVFSSPSSSSHSNSALLLALGLASFAIGSCWRHRPGQVERRRSPDPRIADFCKSYRDTSP